MRPDFTTTWREDSLEAVTRYDLGGHTHHKLDFHFVWRTKFNRKFLGPVLCPFLVEKIIAVCQSKKVRPLGLAIAVNHVHLCARLRPSHSPAAVMRWVKSISSTSVFETFPQLRERFGMSSLWARGYHVESLGDKSVFAILTYLGRQDEKHDLRALEGYLAVIERYLTSPDDGVDEE